ncbi:MAG: hypothetical protein Q9M22_03980 [Mariprofundaceae bacterium]|nr:hypothetical protein [Mariprofundaceae bacterium]
MLVQQDRFHHQRHKQASVFVNVTLTEDHTAIQPLYNRRLKRAKEEHTVPLQVR